MTRDDIARDAYDPEADILEREYDRLWYEIRRLLPRQERLAQLDERSTPEEIELAALHRRITTLRRRTLRYREVLRNENIARSARGPVPKSPIKPDRGPGGTPVLRPRWPWEE